jgi:hypothetical protein
MKEQNKMPKSDENSEFARFSDSMNEWIIFLDSSIRQSKEHIRFLEKRIAELEDRQRINEG